MKQRTTHHDVAARRDEIIRTAAKLFASKGYHATTLDEIARKLGVTKPALYYYVKSKRQLLEEIVNRIMEPMDRVIQTGKSDLPPIDKLRKIIEILVVFGAERKETTLIAFEEQKILTKRTRNAIRSRQKELERVVQEVLREGIEQGHFAVDDVRMTCFAILAVSNWIYRWYRPNGPLTPMQIAEKFIHLLEYGYIKR